MDGESVTGFDVAGAACFGAGLAICAEGVVAVFVAAGAPVGFAAGMPAGFATPDAGADVDFTCPGISEDCVTGRT